MFRISYIFSVLVVVIRLNLQWALLFIYTLITVMELKWVGTSFVVFNVMDDGMV
jgi:hypothetical protein